MSKRKKEMKKKKRNERKRRNYGQSLCETVTKRQNAKIIGNQYTQPRKIFSSFESRIFRFSFSHSNTYTNTRSEMHQHAKKATAHKIHHLHIEKESAKEWETYTRVVDCIIWLNGKRTH